MRPTDYSSNPDELDRVYATAYDGAVGESKGHFQAVANGMALETPSKTLKQAAASTLSEAIGRAEVVSQ